MIGISLVHLDPKIPIMVLPGTIWSFQVLNKVFYLWQPEAPKKVLWSTFFLRVWANNQFSARYKANNWHCMAREMVLKDLCHGECASIFTRECSKQDDRCRQMLGLQCLPRSLSARTVRVCQEAVPSKKHFTQPTRWIALRLSFKWTLVKW